MAFFQFGQLIPVYMIRLLLHLFDQRELFESVVRGVIVAYGKESSHLFFPLTYESYGYWARWYYNVELLLGLSVAGSISLTVGERRPREMEGGEEVLSLRRYCLN